jgi:hypothetical protein
MAQPTEEPGQKGVTSLLAGEGMAIKPEGWTGTHMRGRAVEEWVNEHDTLEIAQAVENIPNVQAVSGGNGHVWTHG